MGPHLQAHEQISKQKKRLSRPVSVPFKREKFQRSLNHILLFFYRCRMLLYTLKFPLNRTELRVSLHGWFRATSPSSAPVCSPRPICCLWGVPLTNKLCVLLQVYPRWQIIHYSWMTELVLFVCLSNHKDSSREVRSQAPQRLLRRSPDGLSRSPRLAWLPFSSSLV